MYPALFKAKYYDEYSNKKDKIESTQGLLFGTSYANAAHILEEYYGNALIQMELTLFEESSILELPEELIEQIKKDNNI